MLRALIENGGITLPKKTEGIAFDYGYDEELFKGAETEPAFAFLEKHSRFFAQGWLEDDSIIIDTIWGADKVEGFGEVTVTYLTPKLKKEELFDFANTFHKANEFELKEQYARAWFD
jgi:hypothetical protein